MKRRAVGLGAAALSVTCTWVVLWASSAAAMAQDERARPRREAAKPQKVDEEQPAEDSAQPVEQATLKPGKRQEPSPPPAPAPPQPPQPQREIASVRLEATVWLVEVPPERLAELDATALAAEAVSPPKLAQVLQKFGTTKVLYRVDQLVTADGGRTGKVEISQNAPYVVSGQKVPAGEGVPSIARDSTGAKFDIFAVKMEGDAPNRVQATVKVELSAMTDSGVSIGGDTTAPAFLRVSQSYGGPTELGKPVVLISADGSRASGPGRSYVFVTLLKMSNP